MSEMKEYDVVRQLGQGGMATVFCVRKKIGSAEFLGIFGRAKTCQELALKQVSCQSTAEGNDALREAKMLQSISHRSIVRYHDVFLARGTDSALQVCIVMEFCQSGDLAAHLVEVRSGGKHIDEKKGTRWMLQICDALAHLHARKIVHRDLKPANVFLDLNSHLKIGDFGLSATLEAGKRASRVGTPCYLPPEILFNEAHGECVDIWGAGCIFYEMMTLDFLWERRGMLGATVRDAPLTAASLPERLSPGLRSIIAACLAYKSAQRPRAQQLCRGLSQSVTSRKPGGIVTDEAAIRGSAGQAQGQKKGAASTVTSREEFLSLASLVNTTLSVVSAVSLFEGSKTDNHDKMLWEAAGRGDRAACKRLLDLNAAVGWRNPDHYQHAPLHQAAAKGHKDTVELLLVHKARVNAQDTLLGRAPLHMAASNGHEDTAALLLQHKASLDLQDGVGRTPAQVALSQKHRGVAALLEQQGGRE